MAILSYRQNIYSYDFVHTWTAIFLEHLMNMSFMALVQAQNEPPAGFLSRVYSLLALAHSVSCFLFQRIKFHTQPLHCLTGRLLTIVQVNNMAALHDTYTDTHIYITLILLFIFFFILLPLPLAGRLSQTLPVWHNYSIEAAVIN